MPRRRSKEKGIVEPSETNMVCVVPKQNVEILGRALHALARIGDELYIEPLNGGLTFRTVHSNHSVYAEVHFSDQFFSYYNCPVQTSNQTDGEDDTDAFKCRINMKSYLAAFRSLPCVRKQVETCLLQIEPTWLMIKFRCHHSLIRTYRLPVIETETLQALYTVDEVPNHLVIGADVFAAAVKNFQQSERDITLAVEEHVAVLRNYVAGGHDSTDVIRSELKLDSGEFISYTVNLKTSITFCLKTFRAVLFFSEPAHLPLSIKFSSPGHPVVIVSNSSTVELRFVLSSLAPEDCDLTCTDSQQLLTPIGSVEDPQQQVQRQKKTQVSKRVSSLDEVWEESGGESKTNQPATSSKTNQEASSKSRLETNKVAQRNNVQTERPSNGAASQRSTTSSTHAVVGTTSSLSSVKKNHADSFAASFNASCDDGQAEPSELVIPESDNEAEEEEDEDVVPASPPPPKRARILFQRCFDPTLNSEDFEGGTVYVPDSDEEED